MSKAYFPAANRTIQYWGGKFVGSKMDTNCACVHTTETTGWPGYSGGASAPHMTIRPNIAARSVSFRQHYPADRSSRALVNLAGGVETNTLNVFQVELIGTCDSRYRKTWGSKKAGVDYIYWPDAPDWLLEAIAPMFQWLDSEWSGFQLADATPRGWVRYPDSYGINARQRMSFAEWRNAYGIFGHQHVPENTHGDPGDFPIARLVAIATGKVEPEPEPTPDPEPVPPKPNPDLLNPAKYPPVGSGTGAQITWLGERLSAWLDVLGLPNAYRVGPGPDWGDADRANVRMFQEAQGWTGSDADGYPGPLTLELLAAPIPPIWFTGIAANLGVSNSYGKPTENTRRAGIIAWVKACDRDVLLLTESATLANLDAFKADLDKIGYKVAVYKAGRCVVVRKSIRVGRSKIVTLKDRGPSSSPNSKQIVLVEAWPDGSAALLEVGHFEYRSGSTFHKTRLAQAKETRVTIEATAKDWGMPLDRVVAYNDEPDPAHRKDSVLTASWTTDYPDVSQVAPYGNPAYSTMVGWDGYGDLDYYRPDKIRVHKTRPVVGGSTYLELRDKGLLDHLPRMFTIARVSKR